VMVGNRFFLGIGVILVNAYIVYRYMNLKEGVRKNVILSHYDFRMKIAVAWIGPELYWTTDENFPATTSWRKRNLTASVALLATAEVN